MQAIKRSLTISEAIRVTGHLLEHHSTTGVPARTKQNTPCSEISRQASCWCYVGAQFAVSEYLKEGSRYGESGFFNVCDRVSGIYSGAEWDEASKFKRRIIYRRLQQYQG